MRLLSWITVFLLAFSPVNADSQKAENIAFLEGVYASLPDDPKFRIAILNAYGIPEDQGQVFVEHSQLMFSQEGFPRYLAEETVAAFPNLDAVGDPDLIPMAQEFGASLMQSKVVLGLKRLNSQDQRAFYEIATLILKNMPASDCAGSMRQSLGAMEMAQAEMKVLLKQDDAFVRDYLALVRKAGFAEIFDDPAYTPLSLSEQQQAQATFEQTFIGALSNHPRGQALIAAADMAPGRPDEDVCEFGSMAIDAALSIDGTVGDWVVKYITQ